MIYTKFGLRDHVVVWTKSVVPNFVIIS